MDDEPVRAATPRARDRAAELHHVLNVMQVVTALLADRRGRLADPAARAQIEWVEQTLQCLIPLASPSEGDDEAGFEGHLRQQMDGWRQLCAGRDIELDVTVKTAAVPAPLQINLALIANELVINALKHAFPDGEAGRIRVSLRPADEQGAELLVSDDGVGLPPDAMGNGLGLGLVERLAGYTGGRLSMESANGLTVRLWFPVASGEGGAAAA